jgi:lysophospholipase L1-like esterase
MSAWPGRLALVAAGLVAALLALEVGVRGAAALWPAAEPAVPPSLRGPELEGLPELKSVFDLARPNQRGVFKGVLYRTNSAGMRGPEVAARPPEGAFRIAVIGDSVTMGQGVDEEATYSARLGEMLAAEAGGVRWEVLNLGIAGMNIVHCIQRLLNVGLRFHPHLIVYGYTLNDIEGPAYAENDPAEVSAYHALLARHHDSPSALVRALWPRLVVLRGAFRPVPGSYEYAMEENYFRRPRAWAQVGAGLDRLAEVARRKGICAVVFVHPVIQNLRFGHGFQRVYERVAGAATSRGLQAIVAFPHFRGRDPAALRFHLIDRHPTAEGHQLLAEALLEGLRELPERCGLPLR